MRTLTGRTPGFRCAQCFIASVMAFASTSALAQLDAPPPVNSWINPSSGNWDQPSNWSSGVLPDSSQSVLITNSGWKAVAINPSTPINFPGSMTVSNLTIRGAWDTENVLFLNYFGTDLPLKVLNGLTLQDMAQIVNFNSGLVVQSGTVLVTNAQIIQDGGFIRTTNATMYLQNAEYDLTNGIFEAGTVNFGLPVFSRINQYGGAAVIANLFFGRGPPFVGVGGNYALYGGYLSLPNGLSLVSDGNSAASYFQSGGTNQTTSVVVEEGSAQITLNGGVLSDNDVSLLAGYYGQANVVQNGGAHLIANSLTIEGGAHSADAVTPATYNLNGGTLSATLIELNANEGDSVFVQANGTVTAQTVYAHSLGFFGRFNDYLTLAGGTLNCLNFTLDDGRGRFNQNGGALIVSNLLTITGYRDLNTRVYGSYTLTGGSLIAGNINITGDWFIGDGSANRISNPGYFSLAHRLVISNAVEQLGRFVLVTNATIDLSGSTSRLSFANSSSQNWAAGATLLIADWNGNPSGGGAEQLRFGTDQSGLTPTQLSQIRFSMGTNLYPARILNTGEVVPDQVVTSPALVNSWINPTSGNWDQPSNWSLGVLPDSSQAVLITNSGWKAVAINPSTPLNSAASMTVSNLTIRGAWDTENVLLLNYLGTDLPLTVLNGLTLQDMAQIVNFNSGLVVQSGTIMVTNSQIMQDGGFIRTTNATMYLQNAEYDLTNGVFEAGTVNFGLPVYSRINQYGGTAVISDLFFGRGPFYGAGGYYALYGGYLTLPRGLSLISDGNSAAGYFQAGGSNQTTTVIVEEGGARLTLNGGLLADTDVNILAGYYGSASIEQNGGTHSIKNALSIQGGAHSATAVTPATYTLNGGTLSTASIDLGADQGDSVFVQSSGTASAGIFYAHSLGYFSAHNSLVTLAGGTFSCSNYTTVDGGGRLDQTGGALVVSNLLDFGGSRDVGRTIYGRYTFTGGTLSASNINITGDWFIGDGSTSRISNPGYFSLAHTLVISNAVEQLGRFILAGDATLDLAGSASRLSFANSSAQSWAGAGTLLISDWNGSPAGGGAEQLKFGTGQSGLTPAQLNHIWFRINTNLYSARILNTGEVVPDQVVPPRLVFSRQGDKLVLDWLPGYSLQTATNVVGPYVDVPGTSFMSTATPPYTNDMTLDPQRFFRLAQ